LNFTQSSEFCTLAQQTVCMDSLSVYSVRIAQALSLDSRNIEALLLKGCALMEVKKMSEAISHFREALRLAPYRYEAYNST